MNDTAKTRFTLIAAGISTLALGLSLAGIGKGTPFDPAWAAILLCGIPIVAGAARALVLERDITADLLVSMAIVSSIIIGEYFAAGEVALIMQIGSLLENFTAERARRGIEKLINLTPRTARLLLGGQERTVPVETVKPGDWLSVRPGVCVPVDGVIIAGETAIDQSVMTGESIPVDKKPGDTVSSGTVNQFGAFRMRAERPSADSSLQRMIRLAREAEANKAPIVRLAEKWAAWMVIAAAATALVTGLATGLWIRAVTVLVVFCPCAFILATPTALLAGIACASRFGLLVRSGEALERLSRVRAIAFDKTGTLTYGKPAVVSVDPAAPRTPAELLRLAALAEQSSEHPLGKAILKAYIDRGGQKPAPSESFRMEPGLGVRARAEGLDLLAGKPAFLRGEGITVPDPAPGNGATAVALAVNGAYAGSVTLSDAIRPDAVGAIARLKRLSIRPLLLTGDGEAAARRIAAQAGIEDVRSSLLPRDKMEALRELGRQGLPACMIGDGVNDALALSSAYAGIAMGGIGSDIAIESSDAVLVSDELRRLPFLFSLARAVMAKVNQNILISLSLNFIAVALSVAGILTPVTGALLHNCGSVFVVVNAALLLRRRDCPPAADVV